ncbi:MAG: peptide ABC transporter substrate-binding protein [Erysipelotrichaceae bacterium]|nr:peptide ABC transporter substrate-binding protein [Erysipelotrichaceae bacterium]
MKKLVVLLLSVLMVLSLTACGSKGSSNGGSKTFTFAVGDQPSYMDPAIASDSIGSYVINQMYFPLFYMGKDNLEMGAAESCEVSSDGLVYTIKLRENYWSDGVKVTAEDYVYGPKHALSIGDAEVSYLSWITDYIVNAKQYVYGDATNMPDLGIKALDDDTIQYTLTKPVGFFTSLLWGGVYYPLRADFAPSGDYTWADTVGYPMNGAFVPTSIDRASTIVMEKNEKWCWADQVNVDTLVAKVITDMDAQLMAFQNKEIDFATSVEAATVSKLDEVKDNFFPSGVINYYVNINCADNATNAALKDVNVRKALSYGIDREAIVEARDDGVTKALYGFVPSGIFTDEGDFRTVGGNLTKYDPELAKQLLAEAGYNAENPLKLEYYYNQNAAHDLVAAVLKEQWSKINVELQLKTADVRTFFADRDEHAVFELARGAMSADYMDALTYLDMATSTYQMKQSWGDATYDAMMLDAASMSGQERIDQLHKAEKYIVEETAQVIPLFEYGSACLRSSKVSGDFNNCQGNSLFWFVKIAD